MEKTIELRIQPEIYEQLLIEIANRNLDIIEHVDEYAYMFAAEYSYIDINRPCEYRYM